MEGIILLWLKIKISGMSLMIILSKNWKKTMKRKLLVVMPIFYFIKKEALILKIFKTMII